MTNRVQGGNDGGWSQGGNWRSQGGSDILETGGSRWTQVTAMKVTHGGADRGRSHGGGRADGSRGQPTAAEQVVVEPEAEIESQRARATGRIQRAKAEQMALATEVEVGI